MGESLESVLAASVDRIMANGERYFDLRNPAWFKYAMVRSLFQNANARLRFL